MPQDALPRSRFAPHYRNSISPAVLFLLLTTATAAWAVDTKSALDATSALNTTPALQAALTKSAGHASRWLDERDYKSLAQSVGGLVLLTEVLQAKGDDPSWQAALQSLLTTAKELQTAARSESLSQCQSALTAVETAVAEVAKHRPAGKPLDLPQPAIRPLMLVLDSVQADGKVALLTGNVAGAKNQAAVLLELSRLLTTARKAEKWSGLAADFQQACQTAAQSTETDAKAIRPLFRGIAERCDACHENSRTR